MSSDPNELLHATAQRLGVDDIEIHTATTAHGAELYGTRLPRAHREEAWEHLTWEHSRSGLWPVLSRRSPAGWADWTHRRPEHLPPPRDIIATATSERTDIFARLIRSQWEEGIDDHAGDPEEWQQHYHELLDPDTVESRIAPWAIRSGVGGPIVPQAGRGYSSEDPRHAPEWLCLLRAQPYEAPAILSAPSTHNWTGSATHPYLELADHVAVLRSWHERYFARLYYLDTASLELKVLLPPMERHEVAQCAVEQYAYCPDLTQFCGETIDVGQKQVRSHHWNFWWD